LFAPPVRLDGKRKAANLATIRDAVSAHLMSCSYIFPVLQEEMNAVHLKARRHQSYVCELRISGDDVTDFALNRQERRFTFTENCKSCPPGSSSRTSAYVYLDRFPKGYTIIFENCGLRTRYTLDDAVPGGPAREYREVVQYHILHPEIQGIPHEEYTNNDGRSDFKRYPVWNQSDETHNNTFKRQFMIRLKEIVEGAGGKLGRPKVEV
jgi:hypothetical protein